jgi:methylmalonyl-CoA/ethylmalonyl-CoA epimerase
VSEQAAPKSLWAGTYQVAVVVHDIERARAFYERLGIGPFVEGPSAAALDRQVYGRPEPDAAIRGLVTRMGAFEFELLQPMGGRTIQAEVLRTRGEGVIHVCAYTDDLDRDMATLAGLGIKPISSARLADGGKFAYFETREVGGLILELFQTGDVWR